MSDLKETLEKLAEELRRARDELEGKWEDFHARSSRVGHEVGEAAEEISDALELLGEELRKGYHRIRKAL